MSSHLYKYADPEFCHLLRNSFSFLLEYNHKEPVKTVILLEVKGDYRVVAPGTLDSIRLLRPRMHSPNLMCNAFQNKSLSLARGPSVILVSQTPGGSVK